MTGLFTPAQAVRAMQQAGAIFTISERASLAATFTYNVASGGDLRRCREIIAAIKTKPPQFDAAFRDLVERSVREGAPR